MLFLSSIKLTKEKISLFFFQCVSALGLATVITAVILPFCQTTKFFNL